MAHGADEFAVAERVISCEFYFATLTFGPSSTLKTRMTALLEAIAFVLRSYFRELPAVLAEQFLQHDFGFLDFGGIKLTFDA